MRELLFGIIGVGIIAPYTAFVPWLWQHGLDVMLFVEQMFANCIAAFFALDVIVSAIVLIAAAVYSHRHGGRGLLGVIVTTLLIGVSAGLPLFLYYRWRDENIIGKKRPVRAQ